MLRWMTPFLAAMFALGTAAAQDSGAAKPADATAAATPADSSAATKSAKPPAGAKTEVPPAATKPAASPAGARRAEKQAAAARAAGQLPPGLPRAHYKYRTTVAPGAAPLYVRRGRTVVVEEETIDLPLISGGIKPYAPRIFGAPLLPGSSTLPGYYGTSHSYSYDGPYYGSPSYWNRLPYACGVYGYC
ncbi:hypothetical protein [Bradyrhizobium roseum]|uniref:hypothetical protein n=1 Tax=Bradyrhizobium roseum TaxID=3056648 RepID=UPI00387E88C0